MKQALNILGELVHNLQCERGYASLFLGSKGALFQDNLERQFQASDRDIAVFAQGRQGWLESDLLHKSQSDKMKDILEKSLPSLEGMRARIKSRALSPSQCITYYSHRLISPLLQIMSETAFYMNGGDPASAYNSFLQWKERVGLERALGSRAFIGAAFQNDEFLERVFFLLSEQENYQNTFSTLATPLQKKLLEHTMQNEAIRRLEAIHEALQDTPEAGILDGFCPKAWFDLVTEKIDALHACEKALVDTLDPDAASSSVSVVEAPKGDLADYDPLIRSLPLLAGIAKETLDQLLHRAQVRMLPKGRILFLEGEQASHLYVILKGWVKVFKGTAAGEETILQMLSSGDSIMESAVFLNTSFPVSAQVAEDATLLSLSASMLREQIRKNHELALSLLASLSQRSRHLIRQIENTRLQSVDERIGWFLLKLLLEQGRNSRCVELPYDKSLIASYLDMKRETFSRALKRLKAKGFRIENDTIVIPSLSALCDYCDADTAQECEGGNSSRCPNPAVSRMKADA